MIKRLLSIMIVLLAVASVAASQTNPITDSRDGKTYRTVKIGDKTWMAESLNYKMDYSYCYADKESNCARYGRLYRGEAAAKACPSGWHLPSKDELESLIAAVGGKQVAGKNLKTKDGWANNGAGVDAFGFSALPAGGRNSYGDFIFEGDHVYFWSSTESGSHVAFYMVLYDSADAAYLSNTSMNNGYSVRCVMD